MALKGFIGKLQGRKWFQAIFIRTTHGGVTDPGFGVFSFAGAPTSGAAGTYFNQAPKGSVLSDTVNGKLYINTGTQASPTWTVVGSQS